MSLDLLKNDGLSPTLASAIAEFAADIDANLDQGRGLWLTGEVGNGKTAVAMFISKSAITAGRSVAIYSLPKLLTRIRATFGDDYSGDSYARLFDRLSTVDLLHIDDLGAEKQSEWVLEQLYSIVNERYEAERSILVTTNLKEPELRKQIGDRTVSRLTEMAAEIEIRGGDRRPMLGPEI